MTDDVGVSPVGRPDPSALVRATRRRAEARRDVLRAKADLAAAQADEADAEATIAELQHNLTGV